LSPVSFAPQAADFRLREVQMKRWFPVHSIRQIDRLLQSKCVRPTTVVPALFFLIPVVALAQGSPFDTGFTAIQSLFTDLTGRSEVSRREQP
jgi:hypothetical protein